MAFSELHFYSDMLGHAVSACVILPEYGRTLIGMESGKQEGESLKTLYLLHGLSDDHTIWMRRSSIERYAAALGIAVIMPDGGRSWYTDMAYGGRYFSFLTEELPEKCRLLFRGISGKKEDTFIAGLSMGGYGAVKAAYTYPERYAAAASLSGAFAVAKEDRIKRGADVREWDAIFGSEPITGSKHDVFALAEKQAELPPTYLWCGKSDVLLPATEKMDAILTERGALHETLITEGDHSWKYWDEHIMPALRWLLDAAKGNKS